MRRRPLLATAAGLCDASRLRPMATLAAFLQRPASAAAAAPALIDRDRPLSRAALEDESARLATGLAALGIGTGDRVALWLPNVPAWLAAFFACGRLGAIAVSVNTRFRSHELADIVGRAGCRAIVCWPGFRNIDFAGILAGCDREALGALTHVVAYDEEGVALPERIHDRPVVGYRALVAAAPMTTDASRPESPCVIFTTSGTTKAPKFVLHDQRTVVRHAGDVARGFGYDAPGTVVLVTAPLCGVFGFTNAMGALAAARPLVMHPTFDASESAQSALRHRVTHTHASDEMIERMLEAAPGTPAFPSARFFGYAAFASKDDLPRRAEARGLTLVGLYGMSECHALMARQSESAPLPGRALAGGKPVAPEARVRARDPETGAIQPHGVAGELEIEAPSCMVGYYGDEAATRAAFTGDGFLRTGDLGYSTDDGGFVFLARLGDALRLSGFLVSPAEIEGELQEHPGVAGAQVVGVETPAGTRAFAFVIAAPGAAFDEQALIAHCAGRIAKFKVPVRVRPIDAFPVTPGANATKIQKAKLRELAQRSL
jgi:fatty-acyl-CoA synthase